MDELLRQLQMNGVNGLKSDRLILLEVLEDKPDQAEEIDRLLNELFIQLRNGKLGVRDQKLERVNFECPRTLLDRLPCTKSQMKITGERFAYRSFFTSMPKVSSLDYEIWPIAENRSVSFLAEVMGSNRMDAEKFMVGMKTELPLQAEKMYTVYKVHDEPAGIVLPHIEPNTDQEGRIFWIGIHPDFQGKGLGRNLHAIGLHRLQTEFKAKSYLGMTQADNVPMRKIMLANGCIENENPLLSLQYYAQE